METLATQTSQWEPRRDVFAKAFGAAFDRVMQFVTRWISPPSPSYEIFQHFTCAAGRCFHRRQFACRADCVSTPTGLPATTCGIRNFTPAVGVLRRQSNGGTIAATRLFTFSVNVQPSPQATQVTHHPEASALQQRRRGKYAEPHRVIVARA